MRTERFVELLTREAGPAPRVAPLASLLPMAAIGFCVALLCTSTAMGLAHEALELAPAFWIKTIYATAIALATAWWLECLARPAAPTRRPMLVLTALVIAMTVASVAWLLQAGPVVRPVLGRSWAMCPWAILLLATPTLAGLLVLLRGLAPVFASRTGFAAGLLAGAAGAAAYAFSCDETSPAFIAIWYSAGILLSGLLGALVGSRFLRW